MGDNAISALRDQGKAALVLVSLAILSVLGMVVLGQFGDVIRNMPGLGNSSSQPIGTNVTAQAAITAFVAGLALFGTFATVMALIIVVKAVISIVKGMQ